MDFIKLCLEHIESGGMGGQTGEVARSKSGEGALLETALLKMTNLDKTSRAAPVSSLRNSMPTVFSPFHL